MESRQVFIFNFQYLFWPILERNFVQKNYWIISDNFKMRSSANYSNDEWEIGQTMVSATSVSFVSLAHIISGKVGFCFTWSGFCRLSVFSFKANISLISGLIDIRINSIGLMKGEWTCCR